MMWNSLPPVRFAEPSSWRWYHSPRVSFSVSSSENSCVPSGKWPQKMIMNDHRLRFRFATALPASVSGADGPGEQREEDVVLERLLLHLRPDRLRHLALLGDRRLAGLDPLDLEVVQRDAVLEERRQQERVERVAEVVGPPRLVLGHPQDPVADVAVLADDVRVRVVHVVVGVAPLVARACGVPLEPLAGQLGILHPVVLAVHHVVADLHVVEDLRQRERGDAAEPGRRQEREEEQPAAGDLERPLRLDHVADVLGVALAAVGEDAGADRVELGAERVELLRRSGRSGSSSGRPRHGFGLGLRGCRCGHGISSDLEVDSR